MALEPLAIEAASIDSWRTLFQGRPDRDLNLVRGKDPLTFERHKDVVVALLTSGCEPEKALRKMTKGRQGLDDCTDDHRVFIQRLAAYLKAWAAAKRIPCPIN